MAALDIATTLRANNIKILAQLGQDPIKILCGLIIQQEAKLEAYANSPKGKHGNLDRDNFNDHLIRFLESTSAEDRKLHQLLLEDLQKKKVKESLKI